MGKAAGAATYQIPMRRFDELVALIDELLEKNQDEKMQRQHFVEDYLMTSKLPSSSFIANYIAEQVMVGK